METKETAIKPPGTMWKVLALAVADGRALLAAETARREAGGPPVYKFSYSKWHTPDVSEVAPRKGAEELCSICFAGSVMARTLCGRDDSCFGPENFGISASALRAVDEMRRGQWVKAAALLRAELPPVGELPVVTSLQSDFEGPEEFAVLLDIMEEAVGVLKAHGC